MNLEVEAQNDGSIHFVAPDKGTIARLSYREVAILYGLSTASTMSPMRAEVFFEMLHASLAAGPLAARLTTLKTAEPSGPLLLFADLGHLQALNLITPSLRHPLLELSQRRPQAPVRLTKQGEILMDCLTTKWAGWAAYTQRFPFSMLSVQI